jgi:hypothetical protein
MRTTFYAVMNVNSSKTMSGLTLPKILKFMFIVIIISWEYKDSILQNIGSSLILIRLQLSYNIMKPAENIFVNNIKYIKELKLFSTLISRCNN